MFDTMTITKLGAALCGSLLIFLLGKWAADGLYSVDGGGGHGDHHAAAYVIDTGEGDGHSDEPEIVIAFADVYATADAGAGERLWRQCQSCHSREEGANGTGPYLHGIVGRDIGSVGGFGYSSILTELEGGWTPEALSDFLENPRGYAPGTAMSYNGMRDIEDRANLIAYLDSLDD